MSRTLQLRPAKSAGLRSGCLSHKRRDQARKFTGDRNMAEEKYDVVVIGAGIAGLGAAALLAKDHGKKVLVVERAPFIGGRAVSFVGRGKQVVVDGLELDANGLKQA